jgi:hypothetical protein
MILLDRHAMDKKLHAMCSRLRSSEKMDPGAR